MQFYVKGNTKLLILCKVHKLKKLFEAVCAEDAAVAYLAAFARSEDFNVAPTSVKGISQRYDVAEFEDRAVGFPYGNIDRVAGVEHRSSGGYVYRTRHYAKYEVRVTSDKVMYMEVGICR